MRPKNGYFVPINGYFVVNEPSKKEFGLVLFYCKNSQNHRAKCWLFLLLNKVV